jgi:DNA repair exonuclease SbcCD ATPase subunit
MNFRVFDFLFGTVLICGIVAAGATFFVPDPYPIAVVGAFAAGAMAFLYFLVRVKVGGVARILDERLAEQEAEAARHRDALQKSFASIENLTQVMSQQLAAAAEKNRADFETLNKNVAVTINQFNSHLEKLAAAEAELRAAHERAVGTLAGRLEGSEKTCHELRSGLDALANDYHAFVTDERHFRDTIQNRLAERVAYLEDFIREKRKSLQI